MALALDELAPGPVNAVTNVSPRQGPTDDQVVNYVNALFQRARTVRRPLVSRWKQNYRALHNRSWAPRAEAWQPSPEVTQIFPVIFSCVAWETDQRPVIEVQPSMQPFSAYADFYQMLAQDMNAILMANFMNYAQDMEIMKCLWDVKTYGIGYFKTTWEAWLADGIGDANFRRVDPFTIYPDPHARSESELTFIIEAKTMTLSDVDRAYPGAMRGAQNTYEQDIDEAPHRLDESTSRLMPRFVLGNLPGASSSNPTQWAVAPNAKDRAVQEEQVVTVLEAWVRGHRVTDTDDPRVKKVRDVWQCFVVCGSSLLMNEEAGDVNAYGTHPYSRLVLTDMGEWYGPALVEMLDAPQESIVRMLTAIEQNLALMGNPVLKEVQNSPSTQRRITNRPGQRVPVRNSTDVEWLQPPQIHPQMSVELIQFYKGEIESISGLSAMIRGFAPSGRNSQGVLDSVQDAAFVRVRAQLRCLEVALRDVCSKMCANIAEFYTEPRHMAYSGPDGKRLHLALRSRHFYTRDADDPDERIPLRFQLLADAGSQLPTSKQARAADAERLYALGLIDRHETLKAKQWPNFSIVANRMDERELVMGPQGPGKRTSTRS
jgi:hypothetical protein